MADATVLLTRLLPLIEKKVREEVDLVLNANDDVLNLSNKLKTIVEVLADAERRLVKDPRIQTWLQKLQEIAYEIDDALEEWEVENFRQQLLLQESGDADESWEKKVCSFLESICLCFKQTVRRRDIALDVKDINQRLDSLAQDNENEFKFIPNLGYDFRDENHQRVQSKSFVEVSEIHGRDLDKDTVISMLLSESSSQGESGVKIVSIVGAGGMGKTTLAQLIFKEVQQFDVKIWVCVSDPFNEISVYTAILGELDKSSSPQSQPNALLKAIGNAIKGQRFLLILDDVWTQDDTETWNPLKVSLKGGCAPGSSILVTTRNERVANVMGSNYMHPLEPLEDEHCWSMLSQIAFYKRKKSDCVMLTEVGREIARKCKGSPLAAKAMGSFLRFKKSNLDEWKAVLKNEIWELERVRDKVFPFLRFSYDELSPMHKRCFSFCALFPKDTILNVDELIRIWIAQDFLSSSSESDRVDQMAVKGYEYFEDLAVRSFFYEFKKDVDDRILECKMHDVLHDFAQYLSKNELLIVEQVNARAKTVSCNGVRHLCMSIPDSGKVTRIPIDEPMKLRSLLCKNILTPNLFTHLKQVRLLIVKGCHLQHIPREIGDLIHIKYLDISDNPAIEKLPETICDLYFLQTLNIEDCKALCGFPKGIHKLINLRYLFNNFVASEFEFSQGLEKLTNLLRLGKFSATKNARLGWLENLNLLGGMLYISVDSTVNEADAKKANLDKKGSIQELVLHCVAVNKLEVVEALQPHPNLRRLRFEGLELPTWVPTITYLTTLEIISIKCRSPDILMDLGKLRFLENLHVMIHGGFHRLGMLNEASFPKLKTLGLHDCYEWQEWEDISEDEYHVILPFLHTFTINRCSRLEALPKHILSKAPSLVNLYISQCDGLTIRYGGKEGQEDWYKILSHVPNVQFSM